MFPVSCCLQRQFKALGAVLCGCLASLFIQLAVASAHEGHDHGDAEKSATVASTYPRVVSRSDLYEIVGILKDDRLSITIDDAKTNAPIRDLAVQVTIGDAPAAEATPGPNGDYSIAFPDPRRTGSAEVIFSVTGKNGDDLLVDTINLTKQDETGATDPQSRFRNFEFAAGVLLVAALCGFLYALLRKRGRAGLASAFGYAALACVVVALVSIGWRRAEDAPGALPTAAVSDAPRRLPDGTAFAAKSTQRLLDVRTDEARSQTVRPASNLIGRVIGDPNRSSIVQSIYGGRVIASDTALPRIGQTVAKGDILVQIEPYLPVADRTTILEKVGEIEQLIAVAETRLRRLRPLATTGAVPTSQIGDLEIELEGLRARRATVHSSRGDREILRAPTDGIITSTNVVPGQVIQPQDILFQIADPKGLWIEAFDYGDNEQGSAIEATAVAPSGQSFALSYLGTSRALRQHASIVHFAIQQPPAGLNIGQPVTVLVQSGKPTTGFIFPRDAIVNNSNGESVVWLHVAPERFEPRPVRTMPLDAARVLIASGLDGSERVVVRGADLVNQVR
jgi:biotin carboxyl carrier protein